MKKKYEAPKAEYVAFYEEENIASLENGDGNMYTSEQDWGVDPYSEE